MSAGQETSDSNGLTDEAENEVAFPQAAMVFAAVCASIFTVVGVGGKTSKQKLVHVYSQ